MQLLFPALALYVPAGHAEQVDLLARDLQAVQAEARGTARAGRQCAVEGRLQRPRWGGGGAAALRRRRREAIPGQDTAAERKGKGPHRGRAAARGARSSGPALRLLTFFGIECFSKQFNGKAVAGTRIRNHPPLAFDATN